MPQGSDAYLILVLVGDGALVDRTGIGGLVSSDRSREAEFSRVAMRGERFGSCRVDRTVLTAVLGVLA